jgi:hypothetical protein
VWHEPPIRGLPQDRHHLLVVESALAHHLLPREGAFFPETNGTKRPAQVRVTSADAPISHPGNRTDPIRNRSSPNSIRTGSMTGLDLRKLIAYWQPKRATPGQFPPASHHVSWPLTPKTASPPTNPICRSIRDQRRAPFGVNVLIASRKSAWPSSSETGSVRVSFVTFGLPPRPGVAVYLVSVLHPVPPRGRSDQHAIIRDDDVAIQLSFVAAHHLGPDRFLQS